MIVIRIPGEMRGKGRPKFSTAGGFPRAYTDAKTVRMETWVKACAVDQGATGALIDHAIEVDIQIRQPPPASWSRKKRGAAVAGELHPAGPIDVDNAAKLILDALNKLVWRDDALISRLIVEKRYAETAETIITIVPALPPAADQPAVDAPRPSPQPGDERHAAPRSPKARRRADPDTAQSVILLPDKSAASAA